MLKNNIMCLKPKIEKFNSFYNMDNKKNYKITEICDNKMLKNVGKIIDHIDDDIFKNDYYTFSNMYNAKKGLTIVYYNNPIGRRIIKKNICSTLMLRELRNIIYGNVYDDIDMKNSQVSIYINLIINLNLDISNYPTLLNCYNNKDYFINDITESLKTTDEREIKKALIKILNGGGHQNIPSLIPLKIEIENLYHNIKDLEQFKKIRKHIKKEKPSFEKGTFMSLVYQSIESKILDLVIDKLTHLNIKIGTLEYDGLKIKKNKNLNTDELLKKINDYIFEKTNYKVEFTYKEMKIPVQYKELLENIEDEDDDDVDEEKFYTDIQMAEYLYEKYKDDVFCSVRGESYIYYFKYNNKWFCNGKKSCLGQFIDRDIKKAKDIFNENLGEMETIYSNYTANNNGYNNVLNTFESILQKSNNLINDFHIKLSISNRHSIPFQDGILKINHDKKGEEMNGKFDFISWDDKDKINKYYPDGYYTRKICNYNYQEIKLLDFTKYTPEEIENSVMNKVFKPAFTTTNFDELNEEEQKIQTEPLNHLLNNYSRMFFACMEDKKWNLIYGSRNSSKGVITELILNSFDEFCETINTGSLCCKDTNGDQAKLLSWIDNKYDCRYLYFNEAKPKIEIDGTLLKQISGGDKIESRSNHKDECKRELNCVINGNVNDIFKVEPKDTWGNCFLYNLKIRFLSDVERKEDYNQFGTPDIYYRQPIADIKTHYCRDKLSCMEFIKLLLDFYDDKMDRTEDMISMVNEEKEEVMENQQEILSKIIKITGNKNDKIPSIFLKNIMNEYLDEEYKKIKTNIKWRDMLKKNTEVRNNISVSYPNYTEKKTIKSYVGICFNNEFYDTKTYDFCEKIKEFYKEYYGEDYEENKKQDEIPKKDDEINSKCLIDTDDDEDEKINNNSNNNNNNHIVFKGNLHDLALLKKKKDNTCCIKNDDYNTYIEDEKFKRNIKKDKEYKMIELGYVKGDDGKFYEDEKINNHEDEQINNDIKNDDEYKMNDLGFVKGDDGKFYKNLDLKKQSKILTFD